LAEILSRVQALEPERVPILDAQGRVLAEEITSEIDIPPFDNSAMDGYAVRSADVVSARPESPVRLTVVGSVAAGYVVGARVEPGTAIRIMTGAPLPEGSDAVVPYEDTSDFDRPKGERLALPANEIEVRQAAEVGANVRPVGEDIRRGELVMAPGRVIRPQEIGVLASLGHETVLVHRRPRVAILATGDEVIEIDAPWQPGKIRNANSYSNAAQVVRYGGVPLLLGIARDDVAELTAKIQAGLEQGADLFLTSGGVSVGDFDVVKTVLAAEGEMSFWRVRMKPGKPLAFGHIGPSASSGRRVPLLGLPGNPVSAMVSFGLFARPAILKMLGHTRLGRPAVEATLLDEVKRKDDRRHYLRVTLKEQEGELFARLTGNQGSGILLSMVRAQGLAIIPEDMDHLPAGSRVQVLTLD